MNEDNAAGTRTGQPESVVDIGDEEVAPMEWVTVAPTQISEVNFRAPDSSRFFVTPRRDEGTSRAIVSELESETAWGKEAIRSNMEPLYSSHPYDNPSGDDALFQAAFASKMTLKFGYYWDDKGIRYERFGEEGNYTYEVLTSIAEGEYTIPEEVVDRMVQNAVDHALGTFLP